jgi:hypothetical protein
VAFYDNISSVYMSRNPVHHWRTKHIELDMHFVREKVTIGELRVTHVPSARQLADVFTKGLPSALFFDFRDNISVTAADVETAGVSAGPGLQQLSTPRSSALARPAPSAHPSRPRHRKTRSIAHSRTCPSGYHGAQIRSVRSPALGCIGLAKGH